MFRLDITKLDEGFYTLSSEAEPEPVLVHGYNCTDLDGVFVFGFNTHDGGSLVTLSDLPDGTVIQAVKIVDRAVQFIVEQNNG